MTTRDHLPNSASHLRAPAPGDAVPPRAGGVTTLPAEIRRITAPLAEVTRMTGISRSELYRLLGQGRLRAVKANSRTLVLMDSVLDYLGSLPAATFRTPKA